MVFFFPDTLQIIAIVVFPYCADKHIIKSCQCNKPNVLNMSVLKVVLLK